MVNTKKAEEMKKKRKGMKIPLPITSAPEEFAKQSIKERVRKLTERKKIGLEGVSESFIDRQARKKYGYVTQASKEKIAELTVKNEKLLRERIPDLENASEVAVIISSIEAQEVKGRKITDAAKERLAYAYDYLKEKKNIKPRIYATNPNALVYEFLDDVLSQNIKWRKAKDIPKQEVLNDLVNHKLLSSILTDKETFNYWVNRITKKYGIK